MYALHHRRFISEQVVLDNVIAVFEKQDDVMDIAIDFVKGIPKKVGIHDGSSYYDLISFGYLYIILPNGYVESELYVTEISDDCPQGIARQIYND